MRLNRREELRRHAGVLLRARCSLDFLIRTITLHQTSLCHCLLSLLRPHVVVVLLLRFLVLFSSGIGSHGLTSLLACGLPATRWEELEPLSPAGLVSEEARFSWEDNQKFLTV